MQRSIGIAALLAVFAVDTSAQATLCNQNEQVAFACTADDNKSVAICASADLSATTGYLQYRYGTSSNTELALPATTVTPSNYFQHGVRMGGGAGVNYVHFREGDLVYTVYLAWNRAWHQSGVVVEQNGLSVQQMMCKGTLPMSADSLLFDKARLPKDDNPTFVAP